MREVVVYGCECTGPGRPEKNIESLTAGVAGGCQSPDIPAGEPNSGSLQEQKALLTTEPSPQDPNSCVCMMYGWMNVY